MARTTVRQAVARLLVAWSARPGAGRVGGVRVPRPGGVPKPSPGVFQNSRASRPLTAKELSEQSARVAASLDDETWGSIRGLWERVNLAIADGDEEKAADSRGYRTKRVG